MSTHLHQLNRHLHLGYVAFPSPRGLFASVPSSMTAKTINTEDPLGSEVSLADLNGPGNCAASQCLGGRLSSTAPGVTGGSDLKLECGSLGKRGKVGKTKKKRKEKSKNREPGKGNANIPPPLWAHRAACRLQSYP